MLRSLLALGAAFTMALSAAAAATDASVVIVNRSAWDIHQLFLSPVDEEEWGEDQLGDEVIVSGGRYTLTDIPCDAYDVRLVDEDEDVCVVTAVALCAGKDAWVIDDDALLACQAESE